MVRKASTSVIPSGLGAAAPCAGAEWACPESEKPTISAPPPLSRWRREGRKCLVMAVPPSRRAGGALDRAHDAGVGAASADIVGQRLLDVRLGRIAVLRQECG